MSTYDKLQTLESLYGKSRTEQILDLLIKSEQKTEQYSAVAVIQAEILQKFKITEKVLKKPATGKEKEIKGLFIYLISDIARISNKHIATVEAISSRQLYRYKQKIREYLTTPENSYYYKANREFIDTSKLIIETIKNKINEKS